ncbi:MAG: biotin transporter BioY [Chitinophagales bacterium]
MDRSRIFDLRSLAAVALFAAVIGVLAFVSLPLPFSPVPLSGQSFGVMLAGALLGPRRGPLAVAAYLLLGVCGLPVFAGGKAGPGVLTGPTGGYLWGFVLGSAVTGALAGVHRERPAWQTLSGLILGGIVAVYALGVTQLAAVAGLSLRQAVAAGVLPFLPGDLVKAVAAAAVVRRPSMRLMVRDYFGGQAIPPPAA